MPKDTKGEIYAGQPGGRHLEQRATAGGKKKKKKNTTGFACWTTAVEPACKAHSHT